MTGKRILLVDNMELALKMEEEILRRSGLEILTARSGAEALALTKSQKPDLVLLEQNMPEMSGNECCHAIKTDPELQTTPVILMLTDNSLESIQRAFSSNCDEILSKPLDQAQVVEKITNLVQLQTRKYARLNLSTSVRIDRESQTIAAESVNLNRRGILVKSEAGFTPSLNYHLSFSLSPADQPISVWCRLDRLVPPATDKNPGTHYLALFRFLNIENKIGNRIDQLADFQAKQAAKEAARPQIGQNFAPIYAFIQKPIDDYVVVLKSLLQNVGKPVEGFAPDEQTLFQVSIASLKPWEKKAVSGSAEEDVAVARALALRLKISADQKKLEKIGALTPGDQDTLRALQKSYFALSDQTLDALQSHINARMQAGQLDLMKQINQTKTDSFRIYVGIKALMNRLADPKAAVQAQQFQYQAQEEDQYKVSAFDRPKPKEEPVKKDEYVFEKKKKQGKPYFKITFILLLLASTPFVYQYAMKAAIEDYSHRDPGVTLPLKGQYPIQKLKVNEKLVLVTLESAWDSLTPSQKLDLVTNFYAEVKTLGYDSVTMVLGPGIVAYANPREGTKVLH